MDEIITESAFDTKASHVGFDLFCPCDLHDLFVFYMEVHLAANAAKITGRPYVGCFPRPDFVPAFCLHKRGNRTGLNALSTENAVRPVELVIPHGHDLGPGTAEAVAYGVVDLYEIAGINASSAKNAAGEITYYKRARHFRSIFWLNPDESLRINLVTIGKGL
jgi:hypothetical protein